MAFVSALIYWKYREWWHSLLATKMDTQMERNWMHQVNYDYFLSSISLYEMFLTCPRSYFMLGFLSFSATWKYVKYVPLPAMCKSSLYVYCAAFLCGFSDGTHVRLLIGWKCTGGEGYAAAYKSGLEAGLKVCAHATTGPRFFAQQILNCAASILVHATCSAALQTVHWLLQD